MIPPTSIDGTDITGATIDGTDVQEITVDGDVVFSAVSPNLIHHYEFENDVTDSVGTADLTANSPDGFSSDEKFGSFARSYDGSGSYDSIEQNFVNETGPFTVSWFFKTSSNDAGCMISQAQDFQIDAFLLFVEVDADKVIWFIRNNTNEQNNLSSTTTVTDGNYHHAAVTYDGSTMQLFTDGGDKQTTSFNFTESTQHSAIGALYRTSDIIHFDGLIDDVKVFDEVLSDTEISNLSSTGSI